MGSMRLVACCAACFALVSLAGCSDGGGGTPADGGGGTGGTVADSGNVDATAWDLRLPPDARTGCYTTQDHTVKAGETCGCTEDLFVGPAKHAACPGAEYTCIADPCSRCTCQPATDAGASSDGSTGYEWVCVNLLC